jgi:hypothetical protein
MGRNVKAGKMSIIFFVFSTKSVCHVLHILATEIKGKLLPLGNILA